MPTKNPRLHVVLERPLYSHLKNLARKNGLSLSLEARELIRNAFRSSEKRKSRVYRGKHIKNLVGKLRLGHIDLDEALSRQAHG